jgi:DNA-binding protein H-NS
MNGTGIFLRHLILHSQPIDLQKGTFMNSYQSILAKISVLQKKASTLRETEKKRVVTEIRRLIELHDIQPAELFSNAKSATRKSPSAPGKKRFRPPKYQDPATGKTWNGLGKRPGWLVGDKETYLIATQAGTVDDTSKPKKKVQP